ncbi:ANTAR domain-containing protein [Streptomyces tauricus]|uniref:ANTAR domain-containing protein n=1 Tax=Streptomyces tauricus TaxID=68274 RepID=UPI0037F4BAED
MRPSQRQYHRRGRTGGQTPGLAPRDDSSGSCRFDGTGRAPGQSADALRAEIAQLQEAVARRPVIDMARGVLMTIWSCTADEAWELLLYVSQHSNTKLYTVAEAVLDSVHGEPLPAPLQEHLAAAVARMRAREDGHA